MIGYVPDFFGVYDNLTVSEYMEFFASCYNMDGLVARKRYTARWNRWGWRTGWISTWTDCPAE